MARMSNRARSINKLLVLSVYMRNYKVDLPLTIAFC